MARSVFYSVATKIAAVAVVVSYSAVRADKAELGSGDFVGNHVEVHLSLKYTYNIFGWVSRHQANSGQF